MDVTLEVEVDIREPRWLESCPDAVAVCRRAAREAFARGVGCVSVDTEVSIVLTNDSHIADLNRTYRGREGPTDVLSFENEGIVDAPIAVASGRPLLLGDIVIARETAMQDAARGCHAVDNRLSHLVVHGMLHLLGFDHDLNEDAEEMEGLEVRILSGLGIPDPYGSAGS